MSQTTPSAEQRQVGARHHGTLLMPASASRRWWARSLDGLFIMVVTLVVMVTGLTAGKADVVDVETATAVALISYPAALLLFGALYGCTVSPGQALTRVVFLQAPSSDRLPIRVYRRSANS